MPLPPDHLELLSPARDTDIAREAILHGADAVYIGGPSFGARHNAGNSIADIARLVEFARFYRARIFVTLNTILHDDELETARQLIGQLYEAGIDALIIQDMGILELDIPPLELHASTQCDIRTLDKARFLDAAGFSQLVVARELDLGQIREISQQVDATVEFFIHGALCVAYSGQCYISHAHTGRSANRGDCSQACRLPYSLRDSDGQLIAQDQHLLSLKDNNQTGNLLSLVEAGVRSFKIEGRYKDMGYVKNITAHYRQQLDAILERRPDLQRASSGHTEHFFVPEPDKTFNRGSTDYFVTSRKSDIGAFESPAFTGLAIGRITQVGKRHILATTDVPLSNGDGLNLLYQGTVIGFRASVVELQQQFREQGEERWTYRIAPNEMPEALSRIPLPQILNRNLDHNWQQALQKTSAERRIGLDWQVSLSAERLQLTATSEEGIAVSQSLEGPFGVADKPEQARQQLETQLHKLGNTGYHARTIHLDAEQMFFIPGSQLKALRRDTAAALTEARLQTYTRASRKPEQVPAPVYPQAQLGFLANIYNRKARDFYQRHGVSLIDAAYEAHEETGEVPVMITKHCLRFAFNRCPKQSTKEVRHQPTPMQLIHQGEPLTLTFDCKACEMHVLSRIRKPVLRQPSPGCAGGQCTAQCGPAGDSNS